MLLAGTFSAWHRVHGAEEVWLHHRGAPVALHLWDGTRHQCIVLDDLQATYGGLKITGPSLVSFGA